MVSLQNKDGNWIFITPIDGLELTKDIKEELLVNRVTFVSREKLPRIRQRFKIPVPISELITTKKGFEEYIKNFFSSSNTYAILPYKGKPKEAESNCIRVIEEEISILSLSQLIFSKRQFKQRIRINTSDKSMYYRVININKQSKEFTLNHQKTINSVPLITRKNWVDFHKRFFFFELLKLIRGEIAASKKWRTILHRVAIFAGQSQNSDDLPSCFLWNVMVLEMLLTERGDKIVDQIVEGSEYLLGWDKNWVNGNYEKRIREIYGKRGDFIHKGDKKDIQNDDLLFTDELIFNILFNLIKLRNMIKCRKDIIDFTEKYKAAKLLNQKSKYRFGKLKIVSPYYTQEDYSKI